MPSTTWKLPQQWVYASAVLCFLIIFYFWAEPIVYQNNGIFIYPLDEAYIRMAIGKNLALHQYWGLSGQEYAPASSSLLYPIILALFFKIFGIHAVFPFIINLAAASIWLWVVRRWLQKEGLSPVLQLLALLILVMPIPLPVIVMTGMEHTLQILFSFLFIYDFFDWWGDENPFSRKMPWQVYLYGLLSVAIRYEGLFLVGIACVYLMLRKKWLTSLALGLISLLPIVIYGLYGLRHGGYFLPNSIILKALPIPFDGEHVSRFFNNEPVNRLFFPMITPGTVATGRLLVILPLTYCMILNFPGKHRKYRAILVFCLATTILHMVFSSSFFYYRYEAYLFACDLVVPVLLIVLRARAIFLQKGPAKWGIILAGIIFFYPLAHRAWYAFKDTATACRYTYQRDYQAVTFLKRYYDHVVVHMNDLGIASFYTEAGVADITQGLANMEVANSLEDEYFRPEFVDYQVSKLKPAVALVSDAGLFYKVRQHWTRVASWRAYDFVATRDPEITFYAVDPAAASLLKRNLRQYEASLPGQVRVTYY
ncbi:hypothetical protein Q4E93_20815 [Flavitalea sp. BT771]|uniref:hypothetical protein n=1 Tax=Flavitalea sp. BT771 TaxID=3063329 RepID=UPI0026E38243|nr:hypothetical protein [Flavitalea sp. BT771]MDO6433063.1 hypothetical protein [Flavitalea sp. BT771]MDV6221661.1 hypothetical protein [Flavitalea sp. BT771]